MSSLKRYYYRSLWYHPSTGFRYRNEILPNARGSWYKFISGVRGWYLRIRKGASPCTSLVTRRLLCSIFRRRFRLLRGVSVGINLIIEWGMKSNVLRVNIYNKYMRLPRDNFLNDWRRKIMWGRLRLLLRLTLSGTNPSLSKNFWCECVWSVSSWNSRSRPQNISSTPIPRFDPAAHSTWQETARFER